MKISVIFFSLLVFILFIGCGKDEEKIKREQIYFYDANTSFDNGEFDFAIESYKKFITAVDDDNEPVIQYANLQLAKIFFSKNNYDLAKSYAEKVTSSGLFMESYLLKEEKYIDYGPRSSSTEEEIEEITGFGFSLKGKAKTIIGLCYLKKGDYEQAIDNFKDIKPKSESFYYLALAYGLKGDANEQRNYYEKNLDKGNIGLIETKTWLNNNPETR